MQASARPKQLAESYLQVLCDEHRHMALLYSCLEDMADQLGRGEDVDVSRLHDIMRYVSHYPDLFHHPREEVLFRRLRRVSPRFADAINHATREHKELRALADRIDMLVQTLEADQVLDRRQLVQQLREFIALGRRHMGREEAELFRPALAQLDAETWEHVIEDYAALSPEMDGNRDMQESYARLYEEVVCTEQDNGEF